MAEQVPGGGVADAAAASGLRQQRLKISLPAGPLLAGAAGGGWVRELPSPPSSPLSPKSCGGTGAGGGGLVVDGCVQKRTNVPVFGLKSYREALAEA